MLQVSAWLKFKNFNVILPAALEHCHNCSLSIEDEQKINFWHFKVKNTSAILPLKDPNFKMSNNIPENAPYC